MSWQTINNILARAMTDARFADKLLTNPLQAIYEAGFVLTPEELQVFREAKATDMADLSKTLLAQLRPQEC